MEKNFKTFERFFSTVEGNVLDLTQEAKSAEAGVESETSFDIEDCASSAFDFPLNEPLGKFTMEQMECILKTLEYYKRRYDELWCSYTISKEIWSLKLQDLEKQISQKSQ
jgi:hypothetical protein